MVVSNANYAKSVSTNSQGQVGNFGEKRYKSTMVIAVTMKYSLNGKQTVDDR
jgi:hypothetical protein